MRGGKIKTKHPPPPPGGGGRLKRRDLLKACDHSPSRVRVLRKNVGGMMLVGGGSGTGLGWKVAKLEGGGEGGQLASVTLLSPQIPGAGSYHLERYGGLVSWRKVVVIVRMTAVQTDMNRPTKNPPL